MFVQGPVFYTVPEALGEEKTVGGGRSLTPDGPNIEAEGPERG